MFAYDRLQYANGGLCNAPNIFNAKRKQHSNHPNQSDRGPGNLARSFYLIAIDSVIRPSLPIVLWHQKALPLPSAWE